MATLPTTGLTPPPTVIDNTHRHYDVAIAVVVLMLIATFLTVARFYVRWKTHTFGWDDWAMIPALVSRAYSKANMTNMLRCRSSCT